jgi:hypothetical protein
VKVTAPKLLLIFLAIILAACNSVKSTPIVDITKVYIAMAETGIAMTQTAIPTTTFTPTITPTTPTAIPLELTRIPSSSYEDKIDYAMAVAPTIYNKLPFIKKSKTHPSGEYSGCTQTYDFHNYVHYQVFQPMDVVNNAFLNYFMTEKWEFTEPYSELITWNNNISTPRITYDVFRVSSKDKPSFERLKIILSDETLIRGENFIEVRAELTHAETKENFEYVLEPMTCYYRQESWQWIPLHK